MKNLKNIIASIILVAISFVSYTQTGTDTLKYEFYLTDNTENVDTTFSVTNTVTQVNKFSLSEDTLNLGELNSNMYFSMNDTIYKHPEFGAKDILVSAYVTRIFLYKKDIEYSPNFYALSDVVSVIVGDPTIVEISSIESLIPRLIIDSLEHGVKYKNLIFEISGNGNKFVNVAIDYTVAEEEEEEGPSVSIDTEVIEVSNTRVYPNPVMNSLNIEFETINTDTEVEIYSTNGQLMYKDVEYRNFGINKVSVDMSNYPTGMYIVRLGNEVKKVIKQ